MKRAKPSPLTKEDLGHNVASNNFNLKCKRCGKTWNYEGDKIPQTDYPVYTSCPKCKTSVQIQ